MCIVKGIKALNLIRFLGFHGLNFRSVHQKHSSKKVFKFSSTKLLAILELLIIKIMKHEIFEGRGERKISLLLPFSLVYETQDY